MILATHGWTLIHIPSTVVIVGNLCKMQLLWNISLPWCLSLFCMNVFHSFPLNFHVCLLPPGEWLIKVCALLLVLTLPNQCFYLFIFRWGSHASVCWEGILISCNFPAQTSMIVKWRQQQENTDVNSIEWQMKNECEIDTRGLLCFMLYISPQMSSLLHIWRTQCTRWRIRVQKASSVFHFVAGIGVVVYDMSYIWKE